MGILLDEGSFWAWDRVGVKLSIAHFPPHFSGYKAEDRPVYSGSGPVFRLMNREGKMADKKKASKSSKAMGKKDMKKTKGGTLNFASQLNSAHDISISQGF